MGAKYPLEELAQKIARNLKEFYRTNHQTSVSLRDLHELAHGATVFVKP
jgi:hypothetical protein